MEFKIGDKVRVRADVKRPYYGWGSVNHTSIGIVVELPRADFEMRCDFPGHEDWQAVPDEMELVEDTAFKVGDKVRIRADVAHPQLDWPPATAHDAVGTVVAIDEDGDPACKFSEVVREWLVAANELELVERVNPGLPEELQPVLEALQNGDWGCQRESITTLVGAIVKYDLRPFMS